jgi:MFS family permease
MVRREDTMPGRSIFQSLTHRNFRLFFIGQSLSLVGTWTQTTTMPWLLSRLTDSKSLYGFVLFCATLPALFLPPFAGVIVDRFDRRRLLMVTQALAMLQALALAIIVATGHVQLWHVFVLNLILSMVNAFDLPARQTFLGDMLDSREDLANAIALHSTMINSARLFGPSLAAWLIVAVGEQGSFFVNAASFSAVLVALALMHTRRHVPSVEDEPWLVGLKGGFGYVRRHRPIRSALIVVAFASMFGMPYSLLLPFFTVEQLGAGPGTYGLLMTAPGVGALTACLYIAWRGLKGLTRRLMVGPAIAGAGLIAISFCRSPYPALAVLFFIGFGFMTTLNAANTLLQSMADPEKRGRVMGYYSIAFTGMAPLGNLIVPTLAGWIGTPGTMMLGGAVCVLAALWLRLTINNWRGEVRAQLRPKPVVVQETEVPVGG